ncbi:MAG: heparinase II/III family protein [Deltaproteobacteria bacterium]|nr:heparinase II/III family protein [Deltaproteobacteria bacterium]
MCIGRCGWFIWRIGMLLVALGVLAAPSCWSFPVDPSRPRLYFTAADLPMLRQRLGTTHTVEWHTLVSWTQPEKDDFVEKAGSNASDTHHYIERNAFLYLMLAESEPELAEQHAQTAKNWLLQLATVDLPDGPNDAFEYLWALAIGYDWLYTWPGFTEAEKQQVRDQLIARTDYHVTHTDLEGVFPSIPDTIDPDPDSNNAKSIYDNQASENNLGNVFPGLALWEPDDKYGVNSTAQQYLDAASLRLREIYTATNTHAANGGYWEGQGYVGARLQGEVYFAYAWKVATGEDLFAGSEHLRNAVYYWIYGLRPDGVASREGDQTCRPIGCDRNRFIASILADRYQDGYAQWYVQFTRTLVNDMTLVHSDLPFDWQDIVFYNAALPAADIATLPLYRHFQFGHLVFRTGWNIKRLPTDPLPDDTYLTFSLHDWISGHAHLNGNSFTVFRGGPLAIDSGRYRGTSVNREHEQNYALRTIAHNTITVYRPGEDFGLSATDPDVPFANDGGQEFLWREAKAPDEPWYIEDLADGTRFDTGTLETFAAGADYYYLKGNATDAYHSTGFHAPDDGLVPGHDPDEAKIENFTREMVILSQEPNPLVVMFDRVSALNAGWSKKWLLHSIAEPTVSGTLQSVEVADHITTHAGPLITIDNGGKLFSQTVLPTSATLRKVGGAGYEFWIDDDGTGKKGKNYPVGDKVGQADGENGAWRVEVSPAIAARDDMFLHVLTVSNATTVAAATGLKVDGDLVVGAKIDDHVILFSKDGVPLSEGSYTAPNTTETVTHLLTGFLPGKYHVVQNGTQMVTGPFLTDAYGVLRFTSSGGGSFSVLPAYQLTALSPLTIWVGLKSKNNLGSRFDLRAEVYRDDAVIAVGEVRCVTGLVREANRAMEIEIPFGALANDLLDAEDHFSVRVFARIGTTSGGGKCGGAGSPDKAVGVTLYYDSARRAAKIEATLTPVPLTAYYLHAGKPLFLSEKPPTRITPKRRSSSAVNFLQGNPWKTVGSWSVDIATLGTSS